MSNVGWIKLHRKILNWEWYQDANVCRLYIHLLLTAVYEDKKWHGQELKKGDCIFTLAEISKTLGLTRQQIRTVLDKLQATKNITIKSTNNQHVVNITKYRSFIDYNELNQPQSQPQTQPSINHPEGAFKEINNLNNNIFKNNNSYELLQKEHGSRLDVNLKLSPQWKEFAIKQGLSDPDITFEQFKNYWTSPNAKRPIKKDWLATWRNWVLKEAKAKNNSFLPPSSHTKNSNLENPYEGMSATEIFKARGITL